MRVVHSTHGETSNENQQSMGYHPIKAGEANENGISRQHEKKQVRSNTSQLPMAITLGRQHRSSLPIAILFHAVHQLLPNPHNPV